MNGSLGVLNLTITAKHLLANLANELYNNHGDCLWELVRNSLVASMPQGKWDPKHAHVEVMLCRDHPLSPETLAMEVFDKGSGIPLARLANIGPSMDEGHGARKNYHGAAQKRIGRFAGLALNSRCYDQEDVTTGFYILTRTTVSGPVTMVSMIPALLEMRQPAITTIDESSVELGHRRGIRGTFTSIIIPHSVFNTDAEIRRALEWKIPRKIDLMFKLLVGGKEMVPPPLMSRIVEGQDTGLGVEAYLDCCEEGTGGIWFVDAATGLRTASAQSLGPNRLPYPLYQPSIKGDIFAPGLLENQDSSRSSLNQRFFKTTSWKSTMGFLVARVVPAAKSLLGDTDVFKQSNVVERTVTDFVEMCNKAFGQPDAKNGPPFDLIDRLVKKPNHKPNGNHRSTSGGGGGGGGSGGGTTTVVKPRVLPFNIDGETYLLAKLPADERMFASVDPMNGKVINLNHKKYSALPKQKDARLEHIIMQIFGAIARHKFPDDSHEAIMWVSQQRQRLGGCQPME